MIQAEPLSEVSHHSKVVERDWLAIVRESEICVQTLLCVDRILQILISAFFVVIVFQKQRGSPFIPCPHGSGERGNPGLHHDSQHRCWDRSQSTSFCRRARTAMR